MHAPPLNPRRPRVPPLEPNPSTAAPGTSRRGDALDASKGKLEDDEIQSDLEDLAQPHEEDGVIEEMATLAVNPGLLEGVAAPSVPQGSAHFHEMEDSAIMLELRAGNMSGFDYLIQKYRKPIVNFMYRMVHNQAIAEELA